MTRILMMVALFGTLLVTGGAHAQERTAGSAIDTQMTWSALSNQINGLNGTITALTTKIDQSVLCGKQNKLYAPGAAGADGNGCKDVSLTSNPDYQTLVTAVNNANTNITNLKNVATVTNNYVTKAQVCSATSMIYAPGTAGADANGCVPAATGKPCSMNQAMACGSVGNCVTAARVWNGMKASSYSYTNVPTTWKDGDTYIWHYANTSNDYGGGQCINGTINYFTTGH